MILHLRQLLDYEDRDAAFEGPDLVYLQQVQLVEKVFKLPA